MELVIVAALIVANGFLAMSELALVSAKKPLLERMQRKGSRGAGIALALTRDPGRMLSPVQIGIILVGFVAGAFGGVTIAERGDAWLESLGMRRALQSASPCSWRDRLLRLLSLRVWIGRHVLPAPARTGTSSPSASY